MSQLKVDGLRSVSFTGDSDSLVLQNDGTSKFIHGVSALAGITVTNGLVANTLTYPTADGNAGEFLKTDGSGNLAFDVVTSYDSAKVQGQIDSDFSARSIFDLSDVTSGTVVTNLNADKVDGFNGIAVYDRNGTLLN